MSNEHKELIEGFIECLENRDATKAAVILEKMKNQPFDEDGRGCRKAYALDRCKKFLGDDIAQPLLKDFFDMAIKDYHSDTATVKDMIDYVCQSGGGRYDGTGSIILFLREYQIVKKERAAQGKDMFVPESFAHSPFLRDVADGIFRDERFGSYITKKNDYERDKTTIEKYYEQYGKTFLREKSVYRNGWLDIDNRIEFQHFTRDGKDDTQMELAREKARERYRRNRYNDAGIGVATADEIARRQISGEETRIITPKVGEEVRWQMRDRIGGGLDKIHKDNMTKIKKLREGRQ